MERLGAALAAPLAPVAALALVLGPSAAAAQDGQPATDGAIPNSSPERIIVTAPAIGGDLFPAPPIPAGACLPAAPELGTKAPGFAVDGAKVRKLDDLARLKKRTEARTLFVTGGSFRGVAVGKARLENICFIGTDFAGSDWRGVAASGLGFIDADLSGAKLAGARLPFVLFRDAKMAGVDATGADFSYGRFDGGWGGSIRDLNLSGARLRSFRFECGATRLDGCPIERDGVALVGADLTRASLFSLTVPELSLTGARIDATELSLPQATALTDAALMGPIIVRSRRRATIFFPFEVPRLVEAATAGGGSAAPRTACSGDAVAQAICAAGDPALRELAEEVAALDARAPAALTRPATRSRRRGRRAATPPEAGFAQAREACLTAGDALAECLTPVLTARRAALLAAGVQPGWLAEGGVQLFVSDDVPPPPSGVDDPLFARLQPVLLDSAQSVALLRVEGGAVQAKGQALGGCQLEADRLRYDGGALRTTDGATLLTVTGDRLRPAGETAATGPLRCRPGASFAAMRRVTLDPQSLRTLWEVF